MLVRTVECLEGRVEVELICEPMFGYGREPAAWALVDDSRHTADATGAGQTIRLQTDLALGIEGGQVRARHVLSPGERIYCALSWAEELAVPADVDEADERLATTARYWRAWLDRARIPDHGWRDPIQRSAGARPVRIGNGAFDQRQNDVFGAALDSILLHTRRSKRLPARLWPIIQAQAECAVGVWREPDQGIWEARGKPQHYVSSKLMCWVALDRAAKLADIRGDSELQETWQGVAEEIRSDILEHGVSERGVLRQHYETDALDASLLLAALFGFLPGDDDRLRKTVLAVPDELTDNGFALRYRTEETDDGLSGEEGTFLICSFWLVSALAIVGEQQRAHDLMERLLRIAGRHLGNFPQAFTHLALIEAAGRIILAERIEEIS
jgi:GH15 family glucan-1,4-alpha-glucosidase